MARHVRALAGEVGAPVGAVLEGGYDLGALAASVAATLAAFADDGEPPPSVEPGPLGERAAAHVGRWWPVGASP
jgi:acetoin utilization deacetylase AcuC-like enzyme